MSGRWLRPQTRDHPERRLREPPGRVREEVAAALEGGGSHGASWGSCAWGRRTLGPDLGRVPLRDSRRGFPPSCTRQTRPPSSPSGMWADETSNKFCVGRLSRAPMVSRVRGRWWCTEAILSASEDESSHGAGSGSSFRGDPAERPLSSGSRCARERRDARDRHSWRRDPIVV